MLLSHHPFSIPARLGDSRMRLCGAIKVLLSFLACSLAAVTCMEHGVSPMTTAPGEDHQPSRSCGRTVVVTPEGLKPKGASVSLCCDCEGCPGTGPGALRS